MEFTLFQSLIKHLFAEVVVGSIIFVTIVVWSFILTGQWPPELILWGASIGGALSPTFWRLTRPFATAQTDSLNEAEANSAENEMTGYPPNPTQKSKS